MSRAVKVIVECIQLRVSLAINSAFNWLIIVDFKESIHPLVSVITRLTLSEGNCKYWCEGFCEMDVFPSPKDQLHDTGLVDVSWKFTSIGKHPFNWSKLKPAFALFTNIVSVAIWLIHPLSVMDREICLLPGSSNWIHTLSPELNCEFPLNQL